MPADHAGLDMRAAHNSYARGCHCNYCTEGHRAYCAEMNRRRKLRKDIPHGTRRGYVNYGCHCAACSAANRAYENRDRWAMDEIAQLLDSAGSAKEVLRAIGEVVARTGRGDQPPKPAIPAVVTANP